MVDLDPNVVLSVLFTGRKAAKMKYNQLVLLWILFKQKASQVHKSCMTQFTREICDLLIYVAFVTMYLLQNIRSL